MGYLTLNAIGVLMGSIIDTMRAADMPNDLVRHYLDRLEEGFDECLLGEPRVIMLGLVAVLRSQLPDND